MTMLGPLLLFGLIFLGGVVGLVVLLTNPGTRTAAGAVLAVLCLFAVLAFLSVPVRMETRSRPGVREVEARTTGQPAPPAEAPEPAATQEPTASEGEPPAWLQGKDTWTAEDAYWARVRIGPYLRDESGPSADRPLPRKVGTDELQHVIDRDSLLQGMFQDAVDRAVTRYTGLLEPDHPVQIELPMHFVLTTLVADAWQSAAPGPETIPLEPEQAYGDLVNLHLLLKFDAGTRRQLTDLRRQKIIEARMAMIGRVLFCLLVVLGTLLLYLKTWRPPVHTGAGCVAPPS